MQVDEEASQHDNISFHEPLTDIDRLQYWQNTNRYCNRQEEFKMPHLQNVTRCAVNVAHNSMSKHFARLYRTVNVTCFTIDT